jgi:hypothetical protein
MPAAVLASGRPRPDTTVDPPSPVHPTANPVRVAVALARFEGRKLLRHPAFLIGMALTPWLILAATSDTGASWVHFEIAIVLGLVPLGWLTMVATNLGALRSRRHGTDDLLASLPTTPAARTVAHNLSALATLPVAVGFAAVSAALVAANADPTGAFRPAELATGTLIVVGGGAVGVLVARWLPRPAVCLPALGVTMFMQGKLTDLAPSPARWMSFVVEPLSGFANFELRPAGWHLGWLAAWIALVAVAGVARYGVPRRLGTVALGVAVVALGAGFAQTRPFSAERADAVADHILRPAAHQTCREQADVRYCAYGDLGTHMADWRPPVEGVLARLPGSVRGRGLEVTERPNPVVGNRNCTPVGLLSTLPGPIRDRLSPEGVWPADGKVHPGTETWPCSSSSVHGLFVGVQTGAWAVGLPPGPWHLDQHCRAPGQARAAAALWLGAQSTPGAAEALALLPERTGRNAAGELTVADWADPPAWGVTWSDGDVAAALALLDRPAADVAAVLAGGWDRFTDPATPTSELLARAGVTVAPGAVPVAAGPPELCS